MFSHSCNGTNIFIRWKMKCTIQLGFTSLNGTFHLSPHENICTIALINIHYLYNIYEKNITFKSNKSDSNQVNLICLIKKKKRKRKKQFKKIANPAFGQIAYYFVTPFLFSLQALCDIGIHHLRLLLILGQLASAMLLPIWMVLDLRRILSDYDMVSGLPRKELGVRGMFDGG